MQPIQSQLSLAISRATAEAEVRRMKMMRSLEPGRVAQMLGAQAENARFSPLGYDQLLAVALDAAATPGEASAPVLDALREPPNPVEQMQLRRHVFTAYDADRARAVAKAAPDWALQRVSTQDRADPSRLAQALRREAELNAALWDHPALPVTPGFRALMLACVDALRRRANAIARSRREGAIGPSRPTGARLRRPSPDPSSTNPNSSEEMTR